MPAITTEEYNTFFLNYVYSKGKISISTLINILRKKDKRFQLTDDEYNDEYMIKWGFDLVLRWHCWGDKNYKGCVKPVIEDAKQCYVFDLWKHKKIDHDCDWEIFDQIEWEFKKGGRKMFVRRTIPEVKSTE